MGGIFARMQAQSSLPQRRSAIVGGTRRAPGVNCDRHGRGGWQWRDDAGHWGHGSHASSSTSYWSSTTMTEWAAPTDVEQGQSWSQLQPSQPTYPLPAAYEGRKGRGKGVYKGKAPQEASSDEEDLRDYDW